MKEVVIQMEKDLALSGQQYAFLALNAQELQHELVKILLDLSNRGQLNNLLYRVDLNPNLISDNSLVELAKLIWNKELKKVLFRKLYSATIN